MKSKDFKDLRAKDVNELRKLVYDKKQAISKKRMEIQSGKEKNLKSTGNLGVEVAKILTLIREKEILENLKKEGGSDKSL